MRLRVVLDGARAGAPLRGTGEETTGRCRAPILALCAALVLGSTSCVILPVRSAPGVQGRVVDRTTGEPVAGAVVLVRFDGRYGGDELPDRDLLGHSETITAADGSFSIDRYVRGGLTLWPHFRTERRIVGVIREGYRCANPLTVPDSGRVVVSLEPAQDQADRRDSCRPVSARRGEARAYMAAWQAVFPPERTPEDLERERQLSRLFAARALLGFGANCEGPVRDLALSPDGEHVAFAVEGRDGTSVQLASVGTGPAPGPAAEIMSDAADVPPRRLAWTGAEELILWQPSTEADRAISPSIFAPGHHEVVWRSSEALPAAIDRGTPASSRQTSAHAPLEPADLSDEAETRWFGRSFQAVQKLDAQSGLPRESLRVRRQDGSEYEIELPGESCGTRFGRPHQRITAGGGSGIDLRWIDGGCHAVRIDLESGGYARLDASTDPGRCESERRLPPGQLAAAVHGWSRELEQALAGAGASPGAAYSIHIAPGGRTQVRVRAASGDLTAFDVPRFPVATPLRRIDVTTVGPATPTTRITIEQAPGELEPL